jgi:hypothetical protein
VKSITSGSNAELIAGPRSPFWRKSGVGVVAFPLPEGGVINVVIDGSEMLGVDRFTGTGHVEGRPGSRAVFAWNEGFLHASIADEELGSFALRSATEEYSQFYRVDPALVGACGGPRVPVLDAQVLAAAEARRSRGADLAAAPAAPAVPLAAVDNPQRAEVHVMMLAPSRSSRPCRARLGGGPAGRVRCRDHRSQRQLCGQPHFRPAETRPGRRDDLR